MLFVVGDVLLWICITTVHLVYSRNIARRVDMFRQVLHTGWAHVTMGIFFLLYLFSLTVHPFRPAIIRKHLDYVGLSYPEGTTNEDIDKQVFRDVCENRPDDWSWLTNWLPY